MFKKIINSNVIKSEVINDLINQLISVSVYFKCPTTGFMYIVDDP